MQQKGIKLGLDEHMVKLSDVRRLINKTKREVRKKKEADGYGIDRMIGNYVVDSQVRALNHAIVNIEEFINNK